MMKKKHCQRKCQKSSPMKVNDNLKNKLNMIENVLKLVLHRIINVSRFFYLAMNFGYVMIQRHTLFHSILSLSQRLSATLEFCHIL